jgi:two-component system nitrogen regulation response regulator NtrX
MLMPAIRPLASGPGLLIVDGDPATRRALREFLAGAGFASEEAADADTAIARTGGARPAAIVLHDRLAGAQGLEILEILRANQPDVPVIFIADDGGPEVRAAAARCAVTAYLDKPFRLSDLLASIDRAVYGPKSLSRGRRGSRRAASSRGRSESERTGKMGLPRERFA